MKAFLCLSAVLAAASASGIGLVSHGAVHALILPTDFTVLMLLSPTEFTLSMPQFTMPSMLPQLLLMLLPHIMPQLLLMLPLLTMPQLLLMLPQLTMPQ